MKNHIINLHKRMARLENLVAKDVVLNPQVIEKAYQDASRLSQVDPDLAKALVQAGDKTKDKIQTKNATIAASNLKPSQTTMLPGNSICMLVWMINNNKIDPNLGAIISKDGYIMDGHHRWAAMILLFGNSAKVGGIQVNLPGDALVKVLNVITVGKYGRRNGNAGSGNINDFNVKTVEKLCRQAVESGLPKGIGGKFGCKAEDVKKAFIKQFGDVEVAINAISQNANMINTATPSWAPDRVDMPVLDPDKGQVDGAAGMLSRGEVEVFPPYPDELVVKVGQRRRRRNR
jgi:hypothetical protein